MLLFSMARVGQNVGYAFELLLLLLLLLLLFVSCKFRVPTSIGQTNFHTLV